MKMLTSTQRVEYAISLKEPDVVPIAIIGVNFNFAYCGIPIGEATSNPDLQAKAHLKVFEDFRPDIVYAILVPPIISEAYGSKVKVLVSGYIAVEKPCLTSRSDLDKLEKVSLLDNVKIKAGIKAVNIVKNSIGEQAPVMSGFESSFTTAIRIMGAEKLMLSLYDDPSFVHDALKLITDDLCELAEELVNAGSDMLFIADPAASSSMISPKHYREFALPYEKRLIQKAEQLGARTTLHICGDTTNLMADIASIKPSIFSFDQKVKPKTAKELLGKYCCLMGNIDPTLLLTGSKEEIERAVAICITEAAVNGGFILAPGCGIATKTPPQNLQAMINSARTIGIYPIKTS